MRVLIAGGGTGGHVYIGIALAHELRKRDPGGGILFVGTRRGIESRLVPAAGFALEFIESRGLKGMGVTSLVRNLLIIPRGISESRRILQRFSPHAAVGVGGYSSGPVLLAAWAAGVPTLIVEPNAHPGLANRWLRPFIRRAAVALAEAASHFGGKGVVTGIPVRPEFGEIAPKRREPGRLTLLVYGGSQGSRALNSIVCAELDELKAFGAALRIIHQTGEKELEAVKERYREAGVEADVRDYLPRIYEEFSNADLILARAGASTVAELTVAGKASILVPFPHAADDHQTKNALALERIGASKLIPESQWPRGRLAREIRHFLDAPEGLEGMERAARAAGRPDAAARIADVVLEIAGGGAAELHRNRGA